jgi:DNA replication protein DnaC
MEEPMKKEFQQEKRKLIEMASTSGKNMPEFPKPSRTEQEILRISTEWAKKAKVPPRYIGAHLGQFPDIHKQRAKEFVNGDNGGLFLSGPRGTGKTHLAVAILKERFAVATRRELEESEAPWDIQTSQISAQFVTVPFLLMEIRATFGRTGVDTEKDLIDKYSNARILILDDLGAEKTTDWSISTLYIIIDRRYSNMRPTIITSNLSIEEIAEEIEDRIASRIAEMCKIIRMEGKDRRVLRGGKS